MKNRNIDCRAVSYTDRICFYVNSMQYYEAIDNGDEIEVHLKDDEKNERQREEASSKDIFTWPWRNTRRVHILK